MKRIISSVLALSLATSLVGTAATATINFKDIPKPTSHWAYDTIQWAVNEGITKGYLDGTFKPDNSITEAEFLALLLNIFPNIQLSNLSAGHWADKYYDYSVQMGLPVSNKRGEPITRGAVARLLASSLGFDYNQNRAIEYLFEIGLSNGKTGQKTIEDYQPNSSMTRAEAIQFLRNLHSKYAGKPKFTGLKPIEGQYAAFLNKVKNHVQKNGFDISYKSETSNFNITKEYEVDGEPRTITVITYSKGSSDDQDSYFYINKLDSNVLRLSKELISMIGVPITDAFIQDVSNLGANGGELKKKFGTYTFQYSGDRAQEKVTVRFKNIK